MLCLLTAASAGPLTPSDIPNPRPRGSWVTDAADVLPSEAEARLDARISRLQAELGAEIAVVTAPDVNDVPKQFATTLFNSWGIGASTANNGVLVLLVVERRRVEIEVGYGLEAVLTDGATGALLDQHVIPRFKEGDLPGGIEAGVAALDERLRGAAGEVSEGTGAAIAVPGGAIAVPGGEVSEGTGVSGAEGERLFGWEPEAVVGVGGGAFGLIALGIGWRIWERRRRQCDVCRKEMILLDDAADDAHLDDGQRAEERLKSVDYEVRQCVEHQRIVVIAHTKWFSGFGGCSRCRNRTATRTSRTLIHATYSHGGQVQVTEDCKHCGYHGVTTRTTPRLQRSTSTSGSSGRAGGSRGGSFGGGRSGGGGAGRSW